MGQVGLPPVAAAPFLQKGHSAPVGHGTARCRSLPLRGQAARPKADGLWSLPRDRSAGGGSAPGWTKKDRWTEEAGAGARGRGLLSLRHRTAMQAQEQAFLVVIAKEWRAVRAGAAAQVGGDLGQNHFGDEGQIEAAHLAERNPLQM